MAVYSLNYEVTIWIDKERTLRCMKHTQLRSWVNDYNTVNSWVSENIELYQNKFRNYYSLKKQRKLRHGGFNVIIDCLLERTSIRLYIPVLWSKRFALSSRKVYIVRVNDTQEKWQLEMQFLAACQTEESAILPYAVKKMRGGGDHPVLIFSLTTAPQTSQYVWTQEPDLLYWGWIQVQC